MARIKPTPGAIARYLRRAYTWDAIVALVAFLGGALKLCLSASSPPRTVLESIQSAQNSAFSLPTATAPTTQQAAEHVQHLHDGLNAITNAVMKASGAWGVGDHIAFWALVAVFVAALGKAIAQHKATVEKESPHDLEGVLYALWSVLSADQFGTENDPRLRLTIHVPLKKGGVDMLRQLCDYVGDQRRPRSANREFPASAGVIGQAWKEKKTAVGTWKGENRNTFLKELVEKWHYTDEAANALDPACRAWIAVPIPGEKDGDVEAILYADATVPDYFDAARKALIENAIPGIDRFLDRK